MGSQPLSITFFGGEPGVGELARAVVNGGNTDRLICAETINPGVMTSDKTSDPAMVERINATGAYFLLVASAPKKVRHGCCVTGEPCVCLSSVAWAPR